MTHIAIFSLEADLHAYAVSHALRHRMGVQCSFIVTDTLAMSGGLCWREGEKHLTQLRSADGWVNVADFDVVWWRRIGAPQLLPDESIATTTRDLIDNEWRAALTGAMYDSFTGIWVNDPIRDLLAANKVYQMNVAADVGLRIPRTLVSQDPFAVREFCNRMGGKIVVKKLVGAPPLPLATVLITSADLDDDNSIRVCPAIYQEHVSGGRHIRANCFGGTALSVLIESPWLDWRRDLSVPFSPYQLDDGTTVKLNRLLDRLGLEMGVMDLILEDSGELRWLELNTQGQFLFCEGLADLDLINPFAEFLVSISRRTKSLNS